MTHQHPHQHTSRHSGMNSGFTLMETLIAVMLLTGSMIVIGSAWSSNTARIEKARVNATMAALLERKMTELDFQYRGQPIASIKEADQGTFADVPAVGPPGMDLKNFRWEMTSKEFEIPDLQSLSGQKNDNVGLGQSDLMAQMVLKTVTEYVKQVVREVTVTVIYQAQRKNARELRQSVSTYFVDYSRPIQVPGMGAANALQQQSPQAPQQPTNPQQPSGGSN